MSKNSLNVQLYGYTRNNLGDDMFIRFLISSYPNVNFSINIKNEKHIKPFEGLENLKINIYDNVLDVNTLNNIDACVYIAGSIFMERGNALKHLKDLSIFIETCKQKGIPYYFISSNYGPHETQEYFDISKRVFTNCQNICFRDTYSYNLFSNIENVSYAPDYLFSYNYDNYIGNTEKDTVGISIIDMDIRPHLAKYEKSYLGYIKELVQKYIDEEKKVFLISFCEHEGDEKGIDKIIDSLQENYASKVERLLYKGNIDVFLKEYSKIEYMLCTRFHSMIISNMLSQKTYCLSYSSKIDNVILDLNLYNNFLKIDDLDSAKSIDFDKFTVLSKEKRQLYSIQAKRQVESFNKFVY